MNRMTPIKFLLIALAVIMVITTTTVTASPFMSVHDDLEAMVKSNILENNNFTGKNELTMVSLPTTDVRMGFSIQNVPWAMTSPSNLTLIFSNVKLSVCDIVTTSVAIDRSSYNNDGVYTVSNKGEYDAVLQQTVFRIPIVFDKPLSTLHDFEINVTCVYSEIMPNDLNTVRGAITLLANGAYISTPTTVVKKFNLPLFTTPSTNTITQYCRPDAQGNYALFPLYAFYPTQTISRWDRIYITESWIPRTMNATTCSLDVRGRNSTTVVMNKDDMFTPPGKHGFYLTIPEEIPANTQVTVNCYTNKDAAHYYGKVSRPNERPMLWTLRSVGTNGQEKAVSYVYTDGWATPCLSW